MSVRASITQFVATKPIHLYTFTSVLPFTDEEIIVDVSVETVPVDGTVYFAVTIFGNDVVPEELFVLTSSVI